MPTALAPARFSAALTAASILCLLGAGGVAHADTAPSTAAAPLVVVVPAAPVAPAAPRPGPVPVVTWIAGGLTLASVITGSMLTLTAQSSHDVWWDACGQAHTCASGQTDAASEHQRVVADVAFGVAIASLGTTIVTYLVRPAEPETAERIGAFSVSPAHGGAAFGWARSF